MRVSLTPRRGAMCSEGRGARSAVSLSRHTQVVRQTLFWCLRVSDGAELLGFVSLQSDASSSCPMQHQWDDNTMDCRAGAGTYVCVGHNNTTNGSTITSSETINLFCFYNQCFNKESVKSFPLFFLMYQQPVSRLLISCDWISN